MNPRFSKGTQRLGVISILVLAAIPAEKSFGDISEHKWSQEFGYYRIRPVVDSSEVSGPNLPTGTAADVDDGSSYLLTTSYYYNDNLSFEFIYSGSNKLDVLAKGSISALGEIGSVKYLAPTFTANWTFGNDTWLLRPYVGLGINRMIYSGESTNSKLGMALGGNTKLSVEDTWSTVVTAGITAHITERTYITLSYAYIGSDTTATLTTDTVGTRRDVDLNSKLNITYLNIGYKF